MAALVSFAKHGNTGVHAICKWTAEYRCTRSLPYCARALHYNSSLSLLQDLRASLVGPSNAKAAWTLFILFTYAGIGRVRFMADRNMVGRLKYSRTSLLSRAHALGWRMPLEGVCLWRHLYPQLTVSNWAGRLSDPPLCFHSCTQLKFWYPCSGIKFQYILHQFSFKVAFFLARRPLNKLPQVEIG